MTEIIEQYRAVIETIEGIAATCILYDEENNPQLIVDIPKDELEKSKIEYRVGAVFDFIVKQDGDKEVFIFVPIGPTFKKD